MCYTLSRYSGIVNEILQMRKVALGVELTCPKSQRWSNLTPRSCKGSMCSLRPWSQEDKDKRREASITQILAGQNAM